MNRLRLYLLALAAPSVCSAKTDEGMWLLQLMQQQHSIDMMRKQGLKLEAQDLYNPGGTSLKDTVGIFGGGCTGEIISPEGLVLANHHCGCASIQQHSSIEHDYLTDGFWVTSRDKELPTPGLQFTFIERIEDVTDTVNAKIAVREITESESFSNIFLQKLAHDLYLKSDLADKKGVVPQALPFYARNKFYLFYKKIYPGVRMVATPPSSIDKFGGEADNWIWPHRTGDFSMFRICADASDEPVEYSENNVPLKTKKRLSISIRGLREGDYAVIMGFPGSASRYLTVSEAKERMESEDDLRIRIRDARLAVLREVVDASDKIRIQYANKYAGSSSYRKDSIGMNKAIIDNDVSGTKAAQEAKFAEFAEAQNNAKYVVVVKNIDDLVTKTTPLNYQYACLRETFFGAIEFGNVMLTKTREALLEKNDSVIEARMKALESTYESIHNKGYGHEVDREVAKVLFPLYAEMIPVNQRPSIYKVIEQKYGGDYNKFVGDVYDNSIFTSRANFEKFTKKSSVKVIDNDPALQYCQSRYDLMDTLASQLKGMGQELVLPYEVYIHGLSEMRSPVPSYPDANFTTRLTYGSMKPYGPKGGIHYSYYTTTKGILEKENPGDREFVVPAKLEELAKKKDYGRHVLPNDDIPVCFLSINDITGSNSGSLVLNENGESIGRTFDGNWGSLNGNINFDNNPQRCVDLGIRCVLSILEELGNCEHLINEITIVE